MDFWIQVLLIAVLVDIIFGEMPELLHPVVWMGKLADLFIRVSPRRYRKLYGFIMVFLCVGIIIILAWYLGYTAVGISGVLISAYFLKSSFSIRMLFVSAVGIQKDLENGNIEKVRNDLKTFVGRDTSKLDASRSSSAVIESLAESLVDGILSPLFYYLIFGLPGALAFRMINTLDSMVGYKTEPFKELGTAAAKLDDIVNWVPARISPVFIIISAIFFGKPLDALKTCISDHGRTASPNSGLPMAAVSGALNVKLEKIGYHILGEGFRQPETPHIRKAIYLTGFSSLLIIGVIILIGKVPLVIF